MPTPNLEKVTVYRTTSAYVLENAGLFLWLIGSFISKKVSLSLVQLLLRTNGVTTNLVGLIDVMSQSASESKQDAERDLTLLGVRVLTIRVLVDPNTIKEAYTVPLRSHFLLVSALLDGYGSHSFLHKPAGFFEDDKAVFKKALSNGSQMLCDKIQDYLSIKLDQNDEWEKTPVFDMVRRMTFLILAETLLGIDNEHLLTLYEPLTASLDTFERMWQNPDQFNPWVMFMLYQRLNLMSNELHEHRIAAELPDNFARLHGRPMNVTAIFLVASNLVHFITASILYKCTVFRGHDLSENRLNDLSREVATWRFRDSRIYRYDTGLFFSSVPHHSIGGKACLPRSLTIIPQGDINHHRMITNTWLKEDGRVEEPELFGRARPCPGSSISYAAVKSVFFAVTKKRVMFSPNEEQQANYNQFVKDRRVWKQNHVSHEEPSVTGRWVAQA